jgi:MATE family multidrug resistance protein
MIEAPIAGARSWLDSRLARQVSELVRLAGPVIVARLGIVAMMLVDTVIVGRFSAQELAYQGIGLAVLGTLLVTGVGLMMGTMVMTASAYGAGRFRECGAVWRRSLPYALVLGTLGGAICLAGEPILLATGQEADLARGGGIVMAIAGLGVPANVVYVATAFFLEAIKRPMPAMLMMIAANVVNALLNIVLVWGHLGFPAMGAAGSAWATSIVRVLLAVSLLAYVWWMPDHERFGVRLRPEGGWRRWAQQRRIGYAAGASIGVEASAFTALSIFAGWLGPLPLGAYSISLNLLAFVFMVALGIGTATSVLVGIAHGRRDPQALAFAGWTGLGLNTLAMALFGLLLLALAEVIAGAYASDAALLAMTVPLIAFSSTILIADGGQAVMSNALRGRGETWVPTLTHTIAYVGVMIPLGWLLALPLGRGAMGLLEAILIASIVAVSLLAWRFHALARRDRRLARA